MEVFLRNVLLGTILVSSLALIQSGSSYPANVYLIQKTVNIYTDDSRFTQTTQTVKNNFTGVNLNQVPPRANIQGKIKTVLLELMAKANQLTSMLGLNEDSNKLDNTITQPHGRMSSFEKATTRPIMKPSGQRQKEKRICEPDTTRARARQGREGRRRESDDEGLNGVLEDCIQFPGSSGAGEGTWTLEQLTDWYQNSFSRKPKQPVPVEPRDF